MQKEGWMEMRTEVSGRWERKKGGRDLEIRRFWDYGGFGGIWVIGIGEREGLEMRDNVIEILED